MLFLKPLRGVPEAEVIELAEPLKDAKFVCNFFGMGVTQSRSKYKNGDAGNPKKNERLWTASLKMRLRKC